MTGLTARLTGGAGAISASSGTASSLASVTGGDIANLIGGVQGAALQNAGFHCNALVYSQVLTRLAATGGGLLVIQDGRPVFAGFPVYLSGACPDTPGSGLPIMFFGDARRAATLTERRALVVASSWQAAKGGTFENDQLLLRLTERIAINVHDVSNGTLGSMAMLTGKS